MEALQNSASILLKHNHLEKFVFYKDLPTFAILTNLNTMKKLFLFLSILISTTFIACYNAPAAIIGIKKLADVIEQNKDSYIEEDWEKISEEFAKLEEEFNQQEHTKEEIREFNRQKGRIMGYMAKKAINEFGKELEEFTDEFEGGLEGFLEVFKGLAE